MIVSTNIAGRKGRAPRRPAGTTLWASIDVEWTKNYQIKNGNKPFCYSVIYAAIPCGTTTTNLADLPFSFTSVYLEDPEETAELLASANAAVRTAFASADRVTGHQFTSDLGVLTNASVTPLPDIAAARARWLDRRTDALADRRVIDTRYDTDHVLTCTSRRLVDVCAELNLDVTQPELRGTSMTALHHAYLERHSDEARERISVLNLRHSLSTALVALRATGHVSWNGTLNVNQMLATGLDGAFSWLGHRTFTDLL
ncbi:hypothetical protein [Amycolatopsis sp. lyj-23]|uniref:hypothetical protein n=1 Tax=Amycolatopsis sp. lyj-23 TaxID=2789283 RepID=UPI00397C7586